MAHDAPTEHTFEFARSYLVAGSRVLEVGCGDGRLAARLTAGGYRVLALDANGAAITEAKRRGVDAVQARWPEFEGGPFDAILFTRSLHHITPLNSAVQRARELLTPDGRVIVEDFAFEAADDATAEWLRGIVRIAVRSGAIDITSDKFAGRVLASPRAVDAWQAAHAGHHDLHDSATVAAALTCAFDPIYSSLAPYLYRYVCACLCDVEDTAEIGRAVLEAEERMIGSGAIRAIGRRFVGRSRTV